MTGGGGELPEFSGDVDHTEDDSPATGDRYVEARMRARGLISRSIPLLLWKTVAWPLVRGEGGRMPAVELDLEGGAFSVDDAENAQQGFPDPREKRWDGEKAGTTGGIAAERSLRFSSDSIAAVPRIAPANSRLALDLDDADEDPNITMDRKFMTSSGKKFGAAISPWSSQHLYASGQSKLLFCITESPTIRVAQL